jgi:hypothetical protein
MQTVDGAEVRPFARRSPLGAVCTGAALVGALALLGLGWGLSRTGSATRLAGPFAHEQGYAYLAPLSLHAALPWFLEVPADTPENPQGSTLRVSVNGQPLAAAHSPHDEIRRLGAGRYSHWGDKLYFSLSDNADPNVAGPVIEVTFRPVLRSTLVAALLGVAAASLVVLLRGWRLVGRGLRSVPRLLDSGLRDRSAFAALLLAGTVLPYVVFSFDYGLLSRPLGMIDPVVGLLVFLGGGHVWITAAFYFDRRARAVMGLRPKWYYLLPAAVIACTTALYVALPLAGRQLAYSLFFLSAFWHHARQNVGAFAFLTRAWQLRPMSPAERHVLTWSFVGGMLSTVRFTPLPPAVAGLGPVCYAAGLGTFLLTTALAVWLALREYRASGRLQRPVIFLALATFFWPLAVFGNYTAAVSVGVAHALQYYLFLYYVLYRAPAELGSSLLLGRAAKLLGIDAVGDGREVAGWPRLPLMIAGGLALVLPFAILGVLSYGGMSLLKGFPDYFRNHLDALAYGLYMGWVITHYLVDARIWRMSDPEVRSYHQRSFAFLSAPAQRERIAA